jgi:tetratricopeptide (TPR) repeat protein
MAGRIDEGLEIVGSLAQPDGSLPVDQEHIMAVMAGLGATVQIGDLERGKRLLDAVPPGFLQGDGGPVVVGDAERATALGLHRLQAGDVLGALAVLGSLDELLQPELDPNLHSALALAHAAAGALDEALREADEVDAHDRASYLDRITAGIARGLALARRGDATAATAAFDQVRAAADATEDRVSQALTRLADATAAAARGDADAGTRMWEAEARLAELDLLGTSWRQAYALAAGVPA